MAETKKQSGKKIPSLPQPKKFLLLPKPKIHIIPAVIVFLIPVVLIGWYAINPWFTIPADTVAVILQIAMALFLAALLLLIVLMAVLMYYSAKQRFIAADKARNVVVIILIFLASLTFIISVVYLLQP